MKQIILPAIVALLALSSCTKPAAIQPQQQYRCRIETWGDIPWYHVTTVPFTGTYAQMKAFEQSYYMAPDSTGGIYTARKCVCVPVITAVSSGPSN